MGAILKHSKYDAATWEQCVGSIVDDKPIEQAKEKGETQNFNAEGLMQDAWTLLYKKRVEAAEPTTIEDQVNQSIVEMLQKDTAFEQMREIAKGDKLLSTIGMLETIEGFELPDDAQKSIEEAQDAMSALQQAKDDGAEQSDVDTLEQALEEATEKMNAEVTCAACQMAEATEDALKTVEMAVAAKAWGKGGSGEIEHLSSPDMLVEKLKQCPDLHEIMKLAGRLKNMTMQKHKTKKVRGHDNVVSVEVGDDLSRLLPQELLALKHPALKLDAKRRLVERQMMQLEVVSYETECRGPLVICKDESLSMNGFEHVWATATTLAMLDLAKAEKRACSVIHYADTCDIHSNDFSVKGEGNRLEVATHFYAGCGTDFDEPITMAIEKVDKDLKNADIVFITDGVAGIHKLPEYLEDKKRIGFKFITLQIGGDNCEALADISDEYRIIEADADESIKLVETLL